MRKLNDFTSLILSQPCFTHTKPEERFNKQELCKAVVVFNLALAKTLMTRSAFTPPVIRFYIGQKLFSVNQTQ